MLDNFYKKLDKNEDNKTYKVDVKNRLLNIDNKEFVIPSFFNVENFYNGDVKATDYILAYFGYDYKEYTMVKG